MTKRIPLVLIVGLILTSCSSVANLKTDNIQQNYAVTNSETIEVFSTDKIEKDYLIIGEVVASADAGEDAKIAVNHLKKEAAKLGADAIINLQLEIGYGNWTNAIKASGTAVKFKNK